MPHPLIARLTPPQFWVTWVLLTVRTEGVCGSSNSMLPLQFPSRSPALQCGLRLCSAGLRGPWSSPGWGHQGCGRTWGARMHFLYDGGFLRDISGLGQAFCAQIFCNLCC